MTGIVSDLTPNMNLLLSDVVSYVFLVDKALYNDLKMHSYQWVTWLQRMVRLR